MIWLIPKLVPIKSSTSPMKAKTLVATWSLVLFRCQTIDMIAVCTPHMIAPCRSINNVPHDDYEGRTYNDNESADRIQNRFALFQLCRHYDHIVVCDFMIVKKPKDFVDV